MKRMRKNLVVALAALLLTPALALAQEDSPRPERRRREPPQGEKRGELRKRAIFDKNGDGKLDDAERRAAREQFQRGRGGSPGSGS